MNRNGKPVRSDHRPQLLTLNGIHSGRYNLSAYLGASGNQERAEKEGIVGSRTKARRMTGGLDGGKLTISQA